MTEHSVRHMADGTATTLRIDDVISVECDDPDHVDCYEPMTSWAGDPITRHDDRWHIYEDRRGALHVSGGLVDRESFRFLEGMRRRVRRKQAVEANGGRCPGHYDDDVTLMSGVGIGELRYCGSDGSCQS